MGDSMFGGLWPESWSSPGRVTQASYTAQHDQLMNMMRQMGAMNYGGAPPAPRVAPAELADDPIAVAAWHALDLGASIEDAITAVLRRL